MRPGRFFNLGGGMLDNARFGSHLVAKPTKSFLDPSRFFAPRRWGVIATSVDGVPLVRLHSCCSVCV